MLKIGDKFLYLFLLFAIFMSIDDVNTMLNATMLRHEKAFCMEEYQPSYFRLKPLEWESHGTNWFNGRTWLQFECRGDIALHTHPNNDFRFSREDIDYFHRNNWDYFGLIVSGRVALVGRGGDYWVFGG